MATLITKARVRRDGRLAIPKTAQTRLFLRAGNSIRVTLETPSKVPDSPDVWEDDPLDGIIGIGMGGPGDGAENLDYYLYQRDSL